MPTKCIMWAVGKCDSAYGDFTDHEIEIIEEQSEKVNQELEEIGI